MINNLIEIFQYRDMINSLTRRELRGKYAKSVLGFLWSFMSPMLQIIVYALVFTFIFPSNIPNYYIYLMTGMLPWTFFSDSFLTGTGAIVGNSEMIKKIYFPRETLVIGEVNAKLINMLLSFIVMFLFILVSGVGFGVQLVLLPLIVLEQYMLTLGLSLIISSITVYLRDMEYVSQVIIMAWMWATPIFYDINSVSVQFRKYLYINPLCYNIICYRDILFYHIWPNMQELFVPLVEGIVSLLIGVYTFKHLKKGFVEEL